MPNGLKKTRDYVIEIHTDLRNLKDNFKEHKRNHKWLVGLVFVVPGAVYYLLKLLSEAIK